MALRGTASQGNTTSSATVIINVSGIGIQNGDIVLLFGNFGGGGAQSITWPAGFSAITGCANQNVSGGTIACAWKVAASEPSSYTITPAINDFHAAHCRVYSGRSASQFSAAAATTPVGSASFPLSFSITGVTAVASDDIAVVTFLTGIGAADTLTYTPPAGYANSGQAYGNVNFAPAILFVDKVNAGAGSTGTIGGSCSDSNGGGAAYGAYVVSIAAAAGGGGGATQGFIQMPGPGLASPFTPLQFATFPFSTYVTPAAQLNPVVGSLGRLPLPGPGIDPSRRFQFVSPSLRNPPPAIVPTQSSSSTPYCGGFGFSFLHPGGRVN